MESQRKRPKRTRPLVAAPPDVIDLSDDPVVDLRVPADMSWEESAALIQYSDELADQFADPPTLSRHGSSAR